MPGAKKEATELPAVCLAGVEWRFLGVDFLLTGEVISEWREREAERSVAERAFIAVE